MLVKIIFGIFLILHGVVHLLYMGQSTRLFELTPGLIWPDGAVLLSKLFTTETVRLIATVSLIISAAGFIVGGILFFFDQSWWKTIIIAISIFSSILYLISWDGNMQSIHDKGAVGILLNVLIIIGISAWQYVKFKTI
jgi:hypothetical protein